MKANMKQKMRREFSWGFWRSCTENESREVEGNGKVSMGTSVFRGVLTSDLVVRANGVCGF